MGKQHVWVPDEAEGYVQGVLVSGDPESDEECRVRLPKSGEITFSKKKQKKAGKSDDPENRLFCFEPESLHDDYDDLVHLEDVNGPSILHLLRQRFSRDVIYTSIGTILVSLNPFKRLDIANDDVVDLYATGRRTSPHAFGIAAAAYKSIKDPLISEKQDQAILISGESGAGKTEATKLCFNYLAKVAGSELGLEKRILRANPILESFGNAKTLRNNNSSRFGKWVEIQFDNRGGICGSKTENYLLEKPRVVHPPKDERNYHIFYQMTRALPDDIRAEFALEGPDAYEYLAVSGCTEVEGTDDVADFADTMNAFATLGFSDEETHSVLKLCAALLHCGNVRFRSDQSQAEGSVVENRDTFDTFARLLGVNSESLARALSSRKISIPGQEATFVALGVDKAVDLRNSLARAAYGRLFNWLVERINQSMAGKPSASTNVIGVLDIFGFEIFENNSFEQLCINFANEKLQQHFNHHTFTVEERLYEDEGIKYGTVEYIDNTPALRLIDSKKPQGILAYLDEEIKIPRGSDKGFLEKLKVSFDKQHERFFKPLKPAMVFGVVHYAGDVLYDANGFLEKNKDQLNEDVAQVVSSSSDAFISSLFAESGASKQSVGSQFSSQLDKLMKKLDSCEPHYIRCIKSNSLKVANKYDGSLVLAQLRYSGVFEAVRIRKSGFPFRLSHRDFERKYRCLHYPDPFTESHEENCMLILKDVAEHVDSNDIQVGHTLMLYRGGPHRALERLYAAAMEKVSVSIQAGMRGWKSRKVFKELKSLQPQLEKAILARDKKLLTNVLAEASHCPYENHLVKKARRVLFVIEEEARLTHEIKIVQDLDPETNYERLKNVVERARNISLVTPELKKLEETLSEVGCVKECKANLLAGVESADRAVLEEGLRQAEEIGLSPSCPEIISARDELKRLENEEKLVTDLQEALAKGAIFDGCHATAVEVAHLEESIQAAAVFGIRSTGGCEILGTGRFIMRLRASFRRKDWTACEEIVKEADSLGIAHPEVEAARHEATKQREREECLLRLEKAIPLRNRKEVESVLSLAHELGVPESEVAMQQAAELIRWMNGVDSALASGLNSASPVLLREAIAAAELGQYQSAVLDKAKLLLERVMRIEEDAKAALSELDRDAMQEALKQASEVGYQSETISVTRRLLEDTPIEKFLQLQLRMALSRKQSARVLGLVSALRDNFFATRPSQYTLHNLPTLKDKAGADTWQKDCITEPLTDVRGNMARLAIKVFKNILGCMGDVQYTYPASLQGELLSLADKYPGIRDEIICQIIKQLTQNPSESSEALGWGLLQTCLTRFAVSNEFANYVEHFCRVHRRPDLVRVVHTGLLSLPQPGAPAA